MKRHRNRPPQQDRNFRSAPMSEAGYEAFHAEQVKEYGLKRRLSDAPGGVLAVRGWESPGDSAMITMSEGEIVVLDQPES